MTRLLLCSVLLLTACAGGSESPGAQPPGPRGKGPVVREDLVGRRSCRATGASSATFLWEFTESDFTIARDGSAPIPADVVATIAHAEGDVTRIDGRWALKDGALVLSGMHVARGDGVPGHEAPDVTLAPFRTPVIRFEFGTTQYVLGPR